MTASTSNRRRPISRRRHWPSLVTAVLLGSALASSLDSSRAAEQVPTYRKPCQAFLVGQTEFRCARLPSLPGVANDVTRLAATIHRDEDYDVTVYDPKLGLKRYRVEKGLETVDDSPPTKSFTDAAEQFKGHVERWLDAIPDDCELVLFYLSSHGVVDEGGQFFIALEDSEVEIGAKPGVVAKASGIPYAWLHRTLDQCKAKTVVLVIDACYAGGGKATGPRDGGALAGQPKPSGKVLVMASSRGNQQSLMYPEVRQSLFSFWFDQAMKGQADTRHPKGAVDFNEVYDYVKEKVEFVAPTIHPNSPRRQTPVCQIPMDVDPRQVMVHPPPLSLDELLENSAELIDRELQLRPDIERVCVLQFRSSAMATGQGFHFPNLRNTIADELTTLLCRRAARHGAYEVLNNEHVHDDLSGRKKTREAVLKAVKPMQDCTAAVVTGEIEPCFGAGPNARETTRGTRPTAHDALGLEDDQALVSLSIKLGYKGDVVPFAESGGVAQYGVLTPGQAYAAQPVDVPPVLIPPDPIMNKPGEIAGFSPSQMRDQLEEIRANQGAAVPEPSTWGHPECPFDAYVLVDGKTTRQPTKLKDGVCYVPLAKGDKYAIRFICRARDDHERGPQPLAFVRVLVDGRNVLPEPVDVCRNGIHTVAGQAVCRMAKPVDLDHARPFLITKPGTYPVYGFVERLPDVGKSEATARRFTVADAPPKDIRDEDQIRDQTGIITVAFYQPVARTAHRGRVTIPGDPARITLRLVNTPYVPGEIHAIHTFRYVSWDEFSKL